MTQHDGTPVRVVIVGASFAGQRVHHVLQSQQHRLGLQVTLLSACDFFEFTPGVLRALVEPEHAVKVVVPHRRHVTIGSAVRAQLSSTDTGCGGVLELADGRSMQWDHLVIATGCTYSQPIKPTPCTPTCAQRVAALQAAAHRLKEASSVVIVGGGPVGVELAAEVVGKYGSSKTVTLITSQDRLLPRMAPRARQYAEAWLRRRCVQVVLCEQVVTWPEGAVHTAVGGEVVTNTGRRLVADLVFNCCGAGSEVNVQLFASLIQDQADCEASVQRARKAGIPVQDTLQVKGLPGVWVAGDAAALPFERCAYGADLQAGCVAANIMRCVTGRQQELLTYPQCLLPSASLPPLKEPPSMLVISLYRHDGAMQLSRTVLLGWLPAAAKRFVEAFQLGIARGNRVMGSYWLLNEWLTTCVCSYLTARTATW